MNDENDSTDGELAEMWEEATPVAVAVHPSESGFTWVQSPEVNAGVSATVRVTANFGWLASAHAQPSPVA